MLVFRPEAEADVQAAYRWYETKRSGLGEAFLLSMDSAVARIQRFPQLHPIIHHNLRRALLRRFPYAVFYLLETDRIVVTAVMHQRQEPKQWQDRS